MRIAAARVRAAACAALAIATLLTVTPTAFAAAPPAPSDNVPSDLLTSDLVPAGLIPGIVQAPADLPVDVVSEGAQSAHLELLTLSSPLTISAAAAAPTQTLAARVIASARSHLGAPWVLGTQGPRLFDCSGLVLRAYSDAGVVRKLGGWGNRSGYALYEYGRRHNLVGTTHGQPGDVVIWGGGGHVGIYLGNGMAISALVRGVKIHGIYAVTKRFTAFVHTNLTGLQAARVTKPTKPVPHAKSIGIRHAGPSLLLRVAHSVDARSISTLSAGTRLTLLQIWRDQNGRVWYRVNANRHVGWVAGWLTRT